MIVEVRSSYISSFDVYLYLQEHICITQVTGAIVLHTTRDHGYLQCYGCTIIEGVTCLVLCYEVL